jgi:hypothetical protein
MKLFFLFATTTLLLSAGDPSAISLPSGIPATAVPAGPRAFRYVDAQGKAWIYSKTPFGVVRVEERAPSPAKPENDLDQIRVTEAGETVHFERNTPFGVSRWDRKKGELNDTERAAWERSRSRVSQEQN